MERRIWLGYWDTSFKQKLWYSGNSHGLLCLKTRGGKTRDWLAQIGMTYGGSMLINDPKAQLVNTIGRYRQDVLKQKVYVLNPYRIFLERLKAKGFIDAQYDPITSLLDPEGETFASDSDNLFEGLMPYGGPETHWIDSCRLLGSGIAMDLRKAMTRWSLPDVYATISDGNLHRFCEDAIRTLVEEDPEDENIEHIINRLSRFQGTAAQESKEIQSIISSAITKLGWLSNRPIARNMRSSTVDFRRMRHEPMTVFLVSPGRNLRTCAPWTRTIVNCWADAMLQEEPGEYPVLGVLDEFATSVGNLSSINTLAAMGAGYGCQLLFVIQSLNQLVEMSPKGWQNYLANGFQIFGPPGAGDVFTSDHISRMCGTVEVRSASKSTGGNKPGFQFPMGIQGALNSLGTLTAENSDQINITSQGVPYLRPEAIREMSDNEALIFVEGVKGVIRSGRRPYYEDPEFLLPDGTPKYDEDPYHAAKKP